MTEGWQGWDEYAPFYDWENARTVGRRDVAFWRRLAAEHPGRILELGCGTGRIAIPLLRAGAAIVGIDLVPDLPRWREYDRKVSLHGRRGRTTLTLIESVRQDRRRNLTTFDQEYVERRGAETRVHRFALSFRTLSVPQMSDRLEATGFRVRAVLGDYRGAAWDPRADVWIIIASRK